MTGHTFLPVSLITPSEPVLRGIICDRVGRSGTSEAHDGPCQPRRSTEASCLRPCEPACCAERRRSRLRGSRGWLSVRRRPHSPRQPAAWDLQAAANGPASVHPNRVPARRARVWYDDQREAHRQIYAGDDVVDYQFMGSDPNSADNRWLLDAMQQQIPIIYFLGTSPGRYQPIIPTFIVGWHPERLRVDLAFGVIVGASAQATPPASPERRYALREIKARLHQASFRDAVLSAYGGRCAISHLPNPGCSMPLTSSWMRTSS